MRQQQGQYVSVATSRAPLRSANVYQMLMFEWILFCYYVCMLAAVMRQGHGQGHMLSYCLLFLFFDKLDLTYKYCELEDPLHLSPAINCVRYLSYLCIIDLSILLVRIVIDQQNVQAFIIVMHFMIIIALFLNDFSKRGIKLDINFDSNSIFAKYVTPISMFLFYRTHSPQPQDFWYLSFLFFGANLFLSSQITRIMLMKECYYFGWLQYEQGGKEKTGWNRRRGLRAMIVVCCVMIVCENLLLIFQKIKFEISISIIHSFIVAIAAYLLYIGKLPIRK